MASSRVENRATTRSLWALAVAVSTLWATTRTNDPRALGPSDFISSFGNLPSGRGVQKHRGTCTTSQAPSATSRPGTPRGNGLGVGDSVAWRRGWRGIWKILGGLHDRATNQNQGRSDRLSKRNAASTSQGVGSPKSGEKDYPVSALVDDVTSFMQRLVRLWRI